MHKLLYASICYYHLKNCHEKADYKKTTIDSTKDTIKKYVFISGFIHASPIDSAPHGHFPSGPHELRLFMILS